MCSVVDYIEDYNCSSLHYATRTHGLAVGLRGREQAEEAEKALKDALRTIENLRIAAAAQALSLSQHT